MSKSLVFIDDFSKEEIYEIFKLADEFADDVSQVKPLEGKTVVLFFPESSIRTRVTFEKGIQELGGKTILFPPEALNKKEKITRVKLLRIYMHCQRFIKILKRRNSCLWEQREILGIHGKQPLNLWDLSWSNAVLLDMR